MRRSFVFREGKVWERGTEPPRTPVARSHLPTPAIRSDAMDPVRSMADGRIYDGKSAYYDSVRKAGCEIVGDDTSAFQRRPTHESAGIGVGVGQDISTAIDQLRSR